MSGLAVCCLNIGQEHRHNTQGRPPPASAQNTPCGQSSRPPAHVLWPARLKLSLQHWQGLFWVPSPKKFHTLCLSAIYSLSTSPSSCVGLTTSLDWLMTSLGNHVQPNKMHLLPDFKKTKGLHRQGRWDYCGWQFSTPALREIETEGERGRESCCNFSCGVESSMLKSFEGGTGRLASSRGQIGRGIMCTATSFVSCLFIFTSLNHPWFVLSFDFVYVPFLS